MGPGLQEIARVHHPAAARALTFDNNYFNAHYQEISMGDYTKMVENMLEGVEVRLGEYRYYDMDQVIAEALKKWEQIM